MTDVVGHVDSISLLPPLPEGPLDVRTLTRTSQTARPWTREQIAALCIVDAIVLVVILTGAWEAHSQHTTRGAIAWLTVALMGLAVAGIAHAFWLLRARRVIALAVAVMLDPRRIAAVAPLTTVIEDVPAGVADYVVVVDGSLRFHRPDCMLADAKPTKILSREDAEHSAFYPCEVCTP